MDQLDNEVKTQNSKEAKGKEVKKPSKKVKAWKTLDLELLAVDSVTMTDQQLADKYKVNRSTIYRHKQTTAYHDIYKHVQDVAFYSAMERLQGLTGKAMDFLEATMTEKNTDYYDPSDMTGRDRVAAAKVILEIFTKFNLRTITVIK